MGEAISPFEGLRKKNSLTPKEIKEFREEMKKDANLHPGMTIKPKRGHIFTVFSKATCLSGQETGQIVHPRDEVTVVGVHPMGSASQDAPVRLLISLPNGSKGFVFTQMRKNGKPIFDIVSGGEVEPESASVDADLFNFATELGISTQGLNTGQLQAQVIREIGGSLRELESSGQALGVANLSREGISAQVALEQQKAGTIRQKLREFALKLNISTSGTDENIIAAIITRVEAVLNSPSTGGDAHGLQEGKARLMKRLKELQEMAKQREYFTTILAEIVKPGAMQESVKSCTSYISLSKLPENGKLFGIINTLLDRFFEKNEGSLIIPLAPGITVQPIALTGQKLIGINGTLFTTEAGDEAEMVGPDYIKIKRSDGKFQFINIAAKKWVKLDAGDSDGALFTETKYLDQLSYISIGSKNAILLFSGFQREYTIGQDSLFNSGIITLIHKGEVDYHMVYNTNTHQFVEGNIEGGKGGKHIAFHSLTIQSNGSIKATLLTGSVFTFDKNGMQVPNTESTRDEVHSLKKGETIPGFEAWISLTDEVGSTVIVPAQKNGQIVFFKRKESSKNQFEKTDVFVNNRLQSVSIYSVSNLYFIQGKDEKLLDWGVLSDVNKLGENFLEYTKEGKKFILNARDEKIYEVVGEKATKDKSKTYYGLRSVESEYSILCKEAQNAVLETEYDDSAVIPYTNKTRTELGFTRFAGEKGKYRVIITAPSGVFGIVAIDATSGKLIDIYNMANHQKMGNFTFLCSIDGTWTLGKNTPLGILDTQNIKTFFTAVKEGKIGTIEIIGEGARFYKIAINDSTFAIFDTNAGDFIKYGDTVVLDNTMLNGEEVTVGGKSYKLDGSQVNAQKEPKDWIAGDIVPFQNEQKFVITNAHIGNAFYAFLVKQQPPLDEKTLIIIKNGTDTVNTQPIPLGNNIFAYQIGNTLVAINKGTVGIFKAGGVEQTTIQQGIDLQNLSILYISAEYGYIISAREKFYHLVDNKATEGTKVGSIDKKEIYTFEMPNSGGKQVFVKDGGKMVSLKPTVNSNQTIECFENGIIRIYDTPSYQKVVPESSDTVLGPINQATNAILHRFDTLIAKGNKYFLDENNTLTQASVVRKNLVLLTPDSSDMMSRDTAFRLILTAQKPFEHLKINISIADSSEILDVIKTENAQYKVFFKPENSPPRIYTLINGVLQPNPNQTNTPQ